MPDFDKREKEFSILLSDGNDIHIVTAWQHVNIGAHAGDQLVSARLTPGEADIVADEIKRLAQLARDGKAYRAYD